MFRSKVFNLMGSDPKINFCSVLIGSDANVGRLIEPPHPELKIMIYSKNIRPRLNIGPTAKRKNMACVNHMIYMVNY